MEMSSNQNVVYLFFYSKYSQLCLSIIDNIKKYNINISMEYICVDNKIVRNRILNSKNIRFNSVPCILLVYPNKKIEQYEGLDAVNLVNGIISYYQQIQQANTEQHTEQLSESTIERNEVRPIKAKKKDDIKPKDVRKERVKESVKESVKNEGKTSINKLDKGKKQVKKQSILESSSSSEEEDIRNDSEEEEINDNRNDNKIDNKIVIEEDSENDNGNEEEGDDYENNHSEQEDNTVPSIIKRPKKHVRMNDGNYEDIYQDDDYIPPEYETNKLRGIKTSGKKDTSISSIAQQLAKERELDQENIKPAMSRV